MTHLRQQMIRELELQRKSKYTIQTYVTAVKQLAAHYGRSPEQITRDQVRAYVHFLIIKRKLATGTVNTKLAAIQFFYQKILGQPKFDIEICRKRPGRLPEPLARSEVSKIFELTKNPKHRAILMTAYGACLLYTSPSPRDRQKSRMPSSA